MFTIKTETRSTFKEKKREQKKVVQSVCAEADSIVNGVRAQDYGSAKDNFERTAAIACVLTGKSLSAIDCVAVLMANKLARESCKHKRDNLVDLCGYSEILNRLQEEK